MVTMISQLPRNQQYNYIHSATRGVIEIVDVTLPEGPISIKRYNPAKGQSSSTSAPVTISSQMIQRVANAFTPNNPINFDRILGASYNTRSVLESLIAHTPQFYHCKPGRVDNVGRNSAKVKKGHKHLVWMPDNPHPLGQLAETETAVIISEVPSNAIYYDPIDITNTQSQFEIDDIDIQRRHSQIQVALIRIGEQLGFRTWIAQNDRGILYNNRRISEMSSVVKSLDTENMIFPHAGAVRSAHLIDCIWFKNGRLMPAVMEVEHSTGVTSGLTRMKNFYDHIPPYRDTRYVIVAPDEERGKVVREANRPQFRDLNTRFFSYSAVEELYSLCQRRRIRGITEEFLDSFMESVVTDATHLPYS
ncbi:restriction endonuclease (plasmid) [Exiguobacterium sp. N4-1P]|uniref:restriction endonuclease n=1 Tax=Exiguobacterium sp. N4-1P TaxID=2051906 RepID=UPI000B592432|nr:restriction endonuclease [Exiguobacterium sp. N4-1P]ASI37028.1 restriction endonuclease [Exiguobacterium sp. N4-1P]ASI37680.1 restriction endonuclease [Exiguobacterium sp. N4-1P]